MNAEITRQPEGGIKLIIHDPPKPSLMVDGLTDPEVCSLAQYIYTTAVQADQWTDPVAIEFTDMSGRSTTYTARAHTWRELVISMLKVANPLAVLDSLNIIGHA